MSPGPIPPDRGSGTIGRNGSPPARFRTGISSAAWPLELLANADVFFHVNYRGSLFSFRQRKSQLPQPTHAGIVHRASEACPNRRTDAPYDGPSPSTPQASTRPTPPVPERSASGCGIFEEFRVLRQFGRSRPLARSRTGSSPRIASMGRWWEKGGDPTSIRFSGVHRTTPRGVEPRSPLRRACPSHGEGFHTTESAGSFRGTVREVFVPVRLESQIFQPWQTYITGRNVNVTVASSCRSDLRNGIAELLTEPAQAFGVAWPRSLG